MVRVAVPSEQGGLGDKVAERFGRARKFTIVDVDEKGRIRRVEVVVNEAAGQASSAGVRAAEMLASRGVSVVAGPKPGPKAAAALERLGIKHVEATGMTVKEAVAKAYREAGGSGGQQQ